MPQIDVIIINRLEGEDHLQQTRDSKFCASSHLSKYTLEILAFESKLHLDSQCPRYASIRQHSFDEKYMI